MSTRALRRAQKERAEIELGGIVKSDSDDDHDESGAVSGARPSLFALLGDENENENENDEIEDELDERTENTPNKTSASAVDKFSQTQGQKSSIKQKKKKKKAKAKAHQEPTASSSTQLSNKPGTVDNIDIALQELAIAKDQVASSSTDWGTFVNPDTVELCKLLCIDSQHLYVANEMRRLFGRAALVVDHDENIQRAATRSPRPGDAASLAEAVAGRNAHHGSGLPAILCRRNIFIQGKEEWPREIVTGLSMQIEQNLPGNVVKYRFVRDRRYIYAQSEFDACVRAMDPNMMVNLLRFNPYHISTLLQVAEIAKQDKDHATSGELIERALFAFGRAVHPTFGAAMTAGKARLDFKHFENREFWLACWRYVSNISMRATWRTAYEWARLMLSLSPEEDPYSMKLMIDQLAIRARQAPTFLSLVNSRCFNNKWANLPNIQYSRALALSQAKCETGNAKEVMQNAVSRFPWVANRLYQELGINEIPPPIWGKSPSTELDTLYSELYVAIGLDIWKSPENLTFLKSSLSELRSKDLSKPDFGDISIDEARHVIMLDKPGLISLIPRSITSTINSTFDPLPPRDSSPASVPRQRRPGVFDDDYPEDPQQHLPSPEELIRNDPRRFGQELSFLGRFFDLFRPGSMHTNAIELTQDASGRGEISDEALEDAFERSGVSIPEMRARVARFAALREALAEQPGRRVVSADGYSISIQMNGSTQFSRLVEEQDVNVAEDTSIGHDDEDDQTL